MNLQSSGDDTLHTWEAFNHKVSQAFRWPIVTVSNLLRAEGLIEMARLRVQPRPDGRFPAGLRLTRKAEPAN